MKHFIVLSILFCFLQTTFSAGATPPYKEKMNEGVNTLVEWRDESGIWMKAGWWNSANILTAMLRYADVTNQKERFAPIIKDLFDKTKTQQEGNYINEYYDDEGWWLLAWIEAYKLTGEREYLDMAKVIFNDMATGWSPECNGGIFWKKPKQYKNAIANSLFNLSAARLYWITKDEMYKEWFLKNSEWFLQSGMIQENGMVFDGTKECKPTGREFTYNHGVAMAWLTELYLLTGKKDYLKKAELIADAAIKNLVFPSSGILKEFQEPNDLGADGIQFKGIFMRHLGFLYKVSKKKEYKAFILKNADSIIATNYDAQSKSFGSFWVGPFDKPHPGGHSSALEAIIEAYVLTK